MIGVPRDRQHGSMIELGVIKTVQEVDRAGTAGGETDSQPTSELGVGTGCEGGRLFVTTLNESNLLLVLPQCLEDSIDAVAWYSERGRDSPVDQFPHNDIASRLSHGARLLSGSKSMKQGVHILEFSLLGETEGRWISLC